MSMTEIVNLFGERKIRSVWDEAVAAERLNQLQDPELSVKQALADYRRLGYSERWIARRSSRRSTRRTRVRLTWTLARPPCRRSEGTCDFDKATKKFLTLNGE